MRCAWEVRDSSKHPAPVSEKKPKLLQVVVGQVRQTREIYSAIDEAARVSLEPQPAQPSGDLGHRPTLCSLRVYARAKNARSRNSRARSYPAIKFCGIVRLVRLRCGSTLVGSRTFRLESSSTIRRWPN